MTLVRQRVNWGAKEGLEKKGGSELERFWAGGGEDNNRHLTTGHGKTDPSSRGGTQKKVRWKGGLETAACLGGRRALEFHPPTRQFWERLGE